MREFYADRIERRLAAHVENWDEIKLARRAYSPKDLEAMNINLVGGDPYGGACALDQFFLWHPFKSSVDPLHLRVQRLPHRRLDPSRPRPGAASPASCSRRRFADVRPHGMSMEQRFSGQIMQRDADPAARQPTLGEIGINQFAPYLMNPTVDAEGYVWNALVYDGRVVRYDPDGKIDREIEMPVKKVTSVMFWGPNLDILFVTSMAKTPTVALSRRRCLLKRVFSRSTIWAFEVFQNPYFCGLASSGAQIPCDASWKVMATTKGTTQVEAA